jgi:UDP-glucose 4-epimerase
MKVLVTGGCGFIGSHLIDALVDSGYTVVNVDNLSADNDQFYFNRSKNVTNHHFDVCDTKKLTTISKGCEFIFHLAAESRLGASIANPRKAIDSNIKGVVSVLEAAQANKIKGIVFSSTSSIYGLNANFPLKETEREDCLNAYASTKYAAELFLRNYYEIYGIKSVILRYFNVYGERSPKSGQYALVLGIFEKLLKDGKPLTVTGDGTQERDFIHVKDIAQANIQCIDNFDTNPDMWKAQVFNIGYGETKTIDEIANTLSDSIVYIKKPAGEALNNLSDNTKFKLATDWVPTINVLDWIKEKLL